MAHRSPTRRRARAPARGTTARGPLRRRGDCASDRRPAWHRGRRLAAVPAHGHQPPGRHLGAAYHHDCRHGGVGGGAAVAALVRPRPLAAPAVAAVAAGPSGGAGGCGGRCADVWAAGRHADPGAAYCGDAVRGGGCGLGRTRAAGIRGAGVGSAGGVAAGSVGGDVAGLLAVLRRGGGDLLRRAARGAMSCRKDVGNACGQRWPQRRTPNGR